MTLGACLRSWSSSLADTFCQHNHVKICRTQRTHELHRAPQLLEGTPCQRSPSTSTEQVLVCRRPYGALTILEAKTALREQTGHTLFAVTTGRVYAQSPARHACLSLVARLCAADCAHKMTGGGSAQCVA